MSKKKSGELVATSSNAWTAEQVDLVKRLIFKDATDDELKLFMHVCTRTGLDPFARQIRAQKRRNKKTGVEEMVILTSIDGYRLVASRTGAHAGTDDPVYDDENRPGKATVTVYRIVDHVRCPFVASARWAEYCPPQGQDFMWAKMPTLMLGKVAEALALRKAFPADLSGIYTNEEMDQAEHHQPQDAPPPASSPPAIALPEPPKVIAPNVSREVLAKEINDAKNALKMKNKELLEFAVEITGKAAFGDLTIPEMQGLLVELQCEVGRMKHV